MIKLLHKMHGRYAKITIDEQIARYAKNESWTGKIPYQKTQVYVLIRLRYRVESDS